MPNPVSPPSTITRGGEASRSRQKWDQATGFSCLRLVSRVATAPTWLVPKIRPVR
jgi:hypothetical protein